MHAKQALKTQHGIVVAYVATLGSKVLGALHNIAASLIHFAYIYFYMYAQCVSSNITTSASQS